jgi:hypothetical protein
MLSVMPPSRYCSNGIDQSTPMKPKGYERLTLKTNKQPFPLARDGRRRFSRNPFVFAVKDVQISCRPCGIAPRLGRKGRGERAASEFGLFRRHRPPDAT